MLTGFVCSLASAQEAVDSVVVRASSQGTDSLRVATLCKSAGQIAYADPAKGEAYGQLALTWARQKKQSVGEVAALNTLAMLSRRRGDYATAATYLREALTLAEAAQLFSSQANTLSNFGIVYWNMDRFDDARQYFNRAMAIDQRLGHQQETAYTLQNLGMLFSNQGRADSALVLYNRSLTIFRQVKDENGVASVLNNIGNLYRKQKDYPNALMYLQRAYNAFRRIDNKLSQSTVLSNIGQIYLDQDKLAESREYFARGLEQAQALSALRDIRNGHQGLYQTYKRLNRPDSALAHYEAAVVLQDSMTSAEKNRQILELKMTYERDKALEISQKDTQLARQNTRWALAGGLVLALLGVVLVVALRQRLRLNIAEKKRLEIEAARLQVEQENGRLLLEKQQMDLDHKNRTLASQNMHIAQKNELLNSVKEQIAEIRTKEDGQVSVQKVVRFIEYNLDRTADWEAFRLHFEAVHPGFFDRICQHNPALTARDLRMCAYMRLNLNTKEVASLLNYSVRGVETMRYRLRKKLSVKGDTDLAIWMMKV